MGSISSGLGLSAARASYGGQTTPAGTTGSRLRRADFRRSARVPKVIADMEYYTRGGAANYAAFVDATATIKPRLSEHGPMRVHVTRAPKDGKLLLTIVTNASGHVGQTPEEKLANAHRFAKDNVYTVRLRYDPTGTIHNPDMIPVVSQLTIQPTGKLVVTEDVELTLAKGTTVVEVFPSGSFGVGGYREGRQLVITY